MRKGQLAILPASDGRRAERRIVNLAASLREPGARLGDAEVLNLSETGFMAETDLALEVGGLVWLKLTGLEPTKSRVVWIEGARAGFEFEAPLHPATLELAIAVSRKAPPRRAPGQRLFGPLSR
ncbi:MAG: PilZ domain-containing protein [Allosphingosinicella sp.]|uniref:PilZ domain-containing protein n=1 Tax=Allosphingosinicella sp. TaxID=2823234 RepID=UPI00392B4F8C